ncbi:xanthine dehydrogenase accessory protein XdhC [Epibacterium sp. Ofav1-8]|uniref:xanthine dehydrogenase accessory protein XdhC n=1 Tax=Epibacterium sp. Ofav1-8 TaxID=2917735 RepID=UPI001EF74E5D|nr:xanthine dehydrogenase accessory protein XdhC [Epibacterium sp. Ofav1-8]MCG7624659.1 xanthine dehydrogenase accessory protein XdhC [Epibacterium sp. Ofav1-8]
MGFDVDALRAAVAAHGRVIRVVVAEVRGSAPREVGAAMLVWSGGQSSTIGGGALEFEAAEAARRLDVPRRLSTHSLGPDLGQCCGGSVTLLNEVYTQEDLERLQGDVIARPVRPEPQPLAVTRILNNARAQGQRPKPQLIAGWMVEPVARATQPLWIWGAGHVGRALVGMLAPLPDFDITWVDVLRSKYPEEIPAGVTALPAREPDRLVPHAPSDAHHLILTYSHQLDLALCHRLLGHGFGFAGVIGSKTKWARFRNRLAALGHGPEQIARLTCPIGLPELGKHPQAIAIGVAAELMALSQRSDLKKEHSA